MRCHPLSENKKRPCKIAGTHINLRGTTQIEDKNGPPL